MQQTTMITKRENKLQAKEAEDKTEAGVEEEEFTKDMDDEAGASTAQHKRHQFETSREK